MQRMRIAERPDWRQKADDFGFHFHTMYGEPYWDESACYRFSLQQIEQDLEKPTEELHAMCLEAIDRVIGNEQLLRLFRIPEQHWDLIALSWQKNDATLYSRLDLAYDGQSPARLYENNADTPTSLYETGFWQWLWLEDKISSGELPGDTDQFNSLQDKLIARFRQLGQKQSGQALHLACCRDSAEDYGTVQYLADCASEAGIPIHFVYVEDIGIEGQGRYTDLQERVIRWAFKLYPWEFMLEEAFSQYLYTAGTSWLEPPWKILLSNKALLPLLWQQYPDHPNLLPAFFTEEEARKHSRQYVRKPVFSREGANVSICQNGQIMETSPGPYGAEGFIYQTYHQLPRFDGQFALIGSWLVDDQAAGLSVREDSSPITRDLSRYIPHIISE